MNITPSGSVKTSQAPYMEDEEVQVEKSMPSDYMGEEIDSTLTQDPEIEMPQTEVPQTEVPQEESSAERKTLSNYIFKKLESFGYPGRRLEEFKKKFVKQDISPEGVETVTVEIPDKKYPDQQTGKVETIESDDLAPFVREITKIFGLNFNGAHRSDSKWTINFTSEVVSKAEDEDGMTRDNLDEVYGKPGKGKKGRDVAASTLEEMIKSGKDDLVSKLKNIIGEKDAS